MKRLLPTGKEFQKLSSEYKTASDARVEEMSNALGFSNSHSFVRSMLTFGLVREHKNVLAPPTSLEPVDEAVLKLVRSRPVTIGEISREIDRSEDTVTKTIDALRGIGYEISLDEASRQVAIPQEPAKKFKPTEFKYYKKFYRFGLVADTHFCSKYQQITALYDAYTEFDRQKVDFILHAGDLTDGRNVYRGQDVEVFKSGADEQAEYVIDNYPKSERGIRTYVIGGQHDRSFYRDSGLNIIRAICKEREDLVDRGFYKAEFLVRGLKVGLQHPGGGASYARSYRMQKIIENMMGFIHSIPSAEAPVMQFFGHWHIPCHLPSYMGIDAVSLPCFQSQTPFLEQRGLMPVVGYAIAEIWLDDENNLSNTDIKFFIQNSRIIKEDYR